MPTLPIVVTEEDIKNTNLLLRHLRKVSDAVARLDGRINRLEISPPPPSIPEIRDELQATGRFPIHLENLRGQLADPQPAAVSLTSSAPAGLELQDFKNDQLVVVGSTSTGDTLYRVVGGNPNTLRPISIITTSTATSAHAATHYSTSTSDPLTGSLDANARVGTRLNAGATFLRRRIEFNTSAANSLLDAITLAEDAGNEESDLTFIARFKNATVSGNVTADPWSFIVVNSTANVTVTMPAITGNEGKPVHVVKFSTSTGQVTLARAGGDVFEGGGTTVVLTLSLDRALFIGTSGVWFNIVTKIGGVLF